jgi:hypothetical protein
MVEQLEVVHAADVPVMVDREREPLPAGRRGPGGRTYDQQVAD